MVGTAGDPIQAIFGVPATRLFTGRELVVSHGPLERLPAFLRTGALHSIDSLCRTYTGPVEVAAGSAEAGAQMSVSDAHPAGLLRLGLTVYFVELGRLLPAAQAWARALEHALGLPQCVTLGAFANAAGSGLAVHHDRFDQLLIQIQGSKQFRHSPNDYVERPDTQFSPSGAAPIEWGQSYRRGFPRTTRELLDRGFESVTLEPGSVAYLPSGLWHTTSDQPGESLSVSVVVRAPSRLSLLLNFLQYYAGQSPDWRTPAYGGFGDGADGSEHARFEELLRELGPRLPALRGAEVCRAWSSHAYDVGLASEYPPSLRFARYIRLPSSSAALEPDDDPSKLRCVILSGPTNRPQARTVLGLNAEARPVLDWVLAGARAFSVDEAAQRFPDFEREELEALFAWLAQAALIRPLPAPEWDTGDEADS